MKLLERLKHTLLIATMLAACVPSFADSKSRQRLQELFIWKVSDHLQLSPEEDTKFRSIVEELNKKKQRASVEMRASIRAMDKETDDTKRGKLLVKYQVQLKNYLAVQEEELEKLGTVFDQKKMAKYLVVKSKLTENLRVLMGSGVKSSKKKLAKPKVKIEN